MYHQVFPRDLFNNAKLIKCLGNLILRLEGSHIKITFDETLTENINIDRDISDGSIYATNIKFILGENGDELRFSSPLNSRENYPLVMHWNWDEIEVFDDHGHFSDDFLVWYSKASS
jgi:hypothetical protein